jgi:hypothetical protein
MIEKVVADFQKMHALNHSFFFFNDKEAIPVFQWSKVTVFWEEFCQSGNKLVG